MGRMNDGPWKHDCHPAGWCVCSVVRRPASDHRIYACGFQEKLEPNGATHIWIDNHEGCQKPQGKCDQTGAAFGIVMYECGAVYDNRDDTVSYVNSSRYESETPIQEAERKIQEAKDALAQAHEELQKAKRSTRFGVEPSNGSILKFEKKYDRYDSKAYYYAAIRAADKWYLTSTNGYATDSPMTWDELKKFIGDGKCWKPRNMELLPSA